MTNPNRQLQDAYIVAATRTPVGKSHRGMFRRMRSDDLLIAALHGALKQVPGLDPAAIDDAIVGCAMPEAEQGLNMGRLAVLLAGLPKGVGGVTVNRFCASGLTAVQMAADRIRVGEAEVMIAAGAESMSLVPMSGHRPSFNPKVFDGDENIGIAYGMGLTAEKVAAQWKVGREAQDEFALESHRRALAAQDGGRVRRRDHAGRGGRAHARPRQRRGRGADAHGLPATKARAATPRPRGWPSSSRCSPPRARSPPATARRLPTAPAA